MHTTAATLQTFGNNFNLIPDTASTVYTSNNSFAGTQINFTSPTGAMTRGSGSAISFTPFSTDANMVFHIGGAVNGSPGMMGGWATPFGTHNGYLPDHAFRSRIGPS